MKKHLFSALVALTISIPANAATDPKTLGVFGAWNAYTFNDRGGKVCFMSSQPEKKEASVKSVKRGDIFVFLTHWAKEGGKNVISVSVGYPFKDGSTATLSIGDQTFSLFTEGEMAWTRDQATDDAIASALQKGETLVVKGTSKRGTKTTDTYSLKGSGDAYKTVSKECGV